VPALEAVVDDVDVVFDFRVRLALVTEPREKWRRSVRGGLYEAR